MKSKKKPLKNAAPKYVLEISVKDSDGKILLGHRSEGDAFNYDSRVVKHQFTPGSCENPDEGVNQTTSETIVAVGMNVVKFETNALTFGFEHPTLTSPYKRGQS